MFRPFEMTKTTKLNLTRLFFWPTLESGINITLRLLTFGIFSRGYGLITYLKDLNFTT